MACRAYNDAAAPGPLGEISITPFGRVDDLEAVEIEPDFEIPISRNEELIRKGEDPVTFEHDFREGICGRLPDAKNLSATHVHLKDTMGGKGNWNFPGCGDGAVDFARVLEILERSRLAPESLRLEVTESVVLEYNLDVMQRLRHAAQP